MTASNIVDVVPETRALSNNQDTLPAHRQLTATLRGGSRETNYNGASTIVIAHGRNTKALKIKLCRTIRVPDNAATTSYLPPSLGNFPLFKVRDYADGLPTNTAVKGGVFFPMYQAEAMWIGFEAKHPFVLRVSVGGVNAISGLPLVEDETVREKRRRMLAQGRKNGKNNSRSRSSSGGGAAAAHGLQDYVVVPWQLWLDGIVSEDGKIRQFVAQPRGEGFSVEAQVMGGEKEGGIQIQIVPLRRNTPSRLDVRYEDRHGNVNTRTIDFAARNLDPVNITWAEVKALVRNEFGVPVQNQVLGEVKTGGTTGGTDSTDSAGTVAIDFADTTRLGDVHFPTDFNALSVKNRPTKARRSLYRTVPMDSIPTDPFDNLRSPSVTPPASTVTVSTSGASDRTVYAPNVDHIDIAPGGLIRQTVVRDPYPASIWDDEASVMLTLQMLDPASFSRVTGLPQPSTPVSQSDYAQVGGPFFKLPDEENTGVVGDFSNVKSVAQMMRERAVADGVAVPAEEKDVPVRVVTIGDPQGCWYGGDGDGDGYSVASFGSTFKPVDDLMAELQGLQVQ